MSIKAVPITRPFNNAVRGKAPAATPDKSKPDIKTKTELQAREARRDKPTPKLELTPASHRLAAMKQKTSNQNERRIKVLKESLNGASTKLKNDLRLNVLRGKVKADFGKVRDKGHER